VAGAAELPAPAPAPRALLRAKALVAVPPPLIALTLASAAGAAHLALWGTAAPWGRSAPAGGLLGALGLVWVVCALLLFRHAGTPIHPTARPLQLIEEGPYRIGRHPMYLGLFTMQLGAALAFGAPLLVLAAGVFGVVVARVHVPHEEAQLLQRFGGWYRDYAAATRRWL